MKEIRIETTNGIRVITPEEIAKDKKGDGYCRIEYYFDRIEDDAVYVIPHYIEQHY